MARCLSHYQSDNGNQYWKFDMRTLDNRAGLEQDTLMTRYGSECPLNIILTWILEYAFERRGCDRGGKYLMMKVLPDGLFHKIWQ